MSEPTTSTRPAALPATSARAESLRVLLVEDEADLADPIETCLVQEGYLVRWERFGKPALERMAAHDFDVLLSDVRLPDMNGLLLFEWARENSPSTAVILMSAFGSISEAVNALQHRALHYLHKPFAMSDLLDTLETFAKQKRALSLRPDYGSATVSAADRLRGSSEAMSTLRRRVEAMARSNAPVLIQGETGSGKEVVARAVHECSSRREHPFVAVNCGAIPETLFESELFGHERGAFTGAIRKRAGKFVEAGQGTLFLDEVAELPKHCQVKLLRALEEGVVQPVGAVGVTQTHARILAASNLSLRDQVKKGEFREDLYFRLKVLDIQVPPLRERDDDIPLLVEHFLAQHGRSAVGQDGLTPFAWILLGGYDFPGNVRELEHAIERAVVMSEGQAIDACHLPDDIRGRRQLSPGQDAGALSDAVGVFEARYIKRVLDRFDWSRKQAAYYLGISRKNLWEKIKKYDLQDPSKS